MIDTHVHIGYHFGKDGRAQQPGRDAGRDGAVRRRERLGHAHQRLHHRAERRRRRATRICATPSTAASCPARASSRRSARRTSAPATPTALARVRRQAEGRGRRLHQDLRVEEHSRRRRADDDARRSCRRRAARRRRRACARWCTRRAPRRRSRGGQGGLHAGRARRVRQRRGAEAHGRARRLLRSQHRPRAAELHREQAALSSASATTTTRASRSWRRRCRPTTRCSRRALAAKVKMPMGTDAVAGAHGQNAREIITRVKDGGQDADGRHRRRDIARRGVDGPRARRSARSRRGCRPTSWPSTATRSQDITALRRVAFRHEGRRRLPERARAPARRERPCERLTSLLAVRRWPARCRASAGTQPAMQEWPVYGGDAGGTQVLAARRHQSRRMSRAWSPRGNGGPRKAPLEEFGTRPGNFQNTPLMIDNVLYVSTPYNRVVALDAESGRQQWSLRSARVRRRTAAERHRLRAPRPGRVARQRQAAASSSTRATG